MAHGKFNNHLLRAAAALLLCVVLSASLLFGRLSEYSATDHTQYIPLTKSNAVTNVMIGTEGGEFRRAGGFDPDHPVMMSANPILTSVWFRVVDENTIWKGNTDVEIFRVSYQNGEGQAFVKSGRGDKVIAPGSANSYSFALENTADGPVDYRMSMKAYISANGLTIPVEAKVTRDADHKYLLGSADSYADIR